MSDQSSLNITIRHHGNKAILDMKGEINAYAGDKLNKAYAEAASENNAVILNFSQVDYINSTGIAIIVSILAQARQTHRGLEVFGLSEHYLEIFKITRLSDFMTIHENEETALRS